MHGGDKRQRSCKGAILLMILALSLAGCPTQQKEPAGPPEKIVFAYVDFFPVTFHVAQAKGFFAAEGLDLTLQRHEYGKLALKSVLDGKADMATVTDTPIMLAIASGEKVQVLAVIYSSEKGMAIVVRKDRGIAAPDDLKGKTIGVPLGTSGVFFLEAFFATRGIGRKEVRLIDLRPSEMSEALGQGRVDAVVVRHPFSSLLRIELGDNINAFSDETIYSELMCVAARQELVRSRPGTVGKVLKALVRAQFFIRENPEESRRLVAEFTGIDKGVIDEVWKYYSFRVTLSQALLVSLEDQTRWARRAGIIDPAVRPNYLDFIYTDGLLSVHPEAVRMIRQEGPDEN